MKSKIVCWKMCSRWKLHKSLHSLSAVKWWKFEKKNEKTKRISSSLMVKLFMMKCAERKKKRNQTMTLYRNRNINVITWQIVGRPIDWSIRRYSNDFVVFFFLFLALKCVCIEIFHWIGSVRSRYYRPTKTPQHNLQTHSWQTKCWKKDPKSRRRKKKWSWWDDDFVTSCRHTWVQSIMFWWCNLWKLNNDDFIRTPRKIYI